MEILQELVLNIRYQSCSSEIEDSVTKTEVQWRNETGIASYLKASMIYALAGRTPGVPGCQDKVTLFLVTSVTCGLDGAPGRSFIS